MGRVLELLKERPELTGFELFKAAYPRKKSWGDAQKAWVQTAKVRPPIEKILATIERNLSTGAWRMDEPQYIPYPATWLRAWGWDDE